MIVVNFVLYILVCVIYLIHPNDATVGIIVGMLLIAGAKDAIKEYDAINTRRLE
jgi:hypothetical protein